MSTAEQIFNEVRTLPEDQAQEVLDFVARLEAKREARNEALRQAARGPSPNIAVGSQWEGYNAMNSMIARVFADINIASMA
jgi:hypothetical protein